MKRGDLIEFRRWCETPEIASNTLFRPNQVLPLLDGIKKLQSAVDGLLEEFASNFPDDENSAVDFARDALRESLK